MTRCGLKVTGIALALCSLAAGGCADQLKKENLELRSSNGRLTQDRDSLQGEVAQLKKSNLDLQTQLGEKDVELTRKDERIAQLEPGAAKGGKTPGKEAPKPAAPGWESTAMGDKITVEGDLLFSAGQATLTNAGKTKFNKIIGDLKGPYAGQQVRVYGYTDADPIVKTKNKWQDNLDLSANRAMAVTRHLTSSGIKADRVETVAMGETRPVANNATKAGKEKNRRIEIVVVK